MASQKRGLANTSICRQVMLQYGNARLRVCKILCRVSKIASRIRYQTSMGIYLRVNKRTYVAPRDNEWHPYTIDGHINVFAHFTFITYGVGVPFIIPCCHTHTQSIHIIYLHISHDLAYGVGAPFIIPCGHTSRVPSPTYTGPQKLQNRSTTPCYTKLSNGWHAQR